MWMKSLRSLLGGLLLVLERGFRLVEDGLESGFIGHGEIGEDLAIEVDAGGLKAFDEAAVGKAVGAGGGVDARLPEHAEIALARLAIAGRPGLGFVNSVFRVAEELG